MKNLLLLCALALTSYNCLAADHTYERLEKAISKQDYCGILFEINSLPDRLFQPLTTIIDLPGGENGGMMVEKKVTPLSMIIEEDNATILHKVIKAERKKGSLDLERRFPAVFNSRHLRGYRSMEYADYRNVTPIEYATAVRSMYALQILLANNVVYKPAAQQTGDHFKKACKKAKQTGEISEKIDTLRRMLTIFNEHAKLLQEPEPCAEQLFEKESKILAKLAKKSKNVDGCSLL
jgi:hypothetical protein